MTDSKRCQSCGMPVSDDFYGTEADGTDSEHYCTFCYESGEFTDEDLTLESMVEISVIHMISELGKSESEAQELAESVIPQLKRWKS
jgi:hypothetical protein